MQPTLSPPQSGSCLEIPFPCTGRAVQGAMWGTMWGTVRGAVLGAVQGAVWGAGQTLSATPVLKLHLSHL